MKQTSRMSRSRSVQGLRPSTRSSPSIWCEPEDRVQRRRLARAVRPDQPEDATLLDAEVDARASAGVVPNTFRRPRASMQAMALTLLLRRRLFADGRLAAAAVEQLLRRQSEPLESWPRCAAIVPTGTSRVRLGAEASRAPGFTNIPSPRFVSTSSSPTSSW